MDFKQKDEARNRALDAIEKLVSPEARSFNHHIRVSVKYQRCIFISLKQIYDDPTISDRQTCEGVSAAISSTTDAIRHELNIAPMDCARVFETLAH